MQPAHYGSPSTARIDMAKRQYSHDADIIFMVPALQMTVKTVHHQGPKAPTDDGRNTAYSYQPVERMVCLKIILTSKSVS